MKAAVARVGSIKTRDLIAGLVAINCRDYLESYRGRDDRRSGGRALNVARARTFAKSSPNRVTEM